MYKRILFFFSEHQQMKTILFLATLFPLVSCGQKQPTTSPSETVSATEKATSSNDKISELDIQKKEEDCPPGVKIACNVPTMTQDEIDSINAANKQCFEECVQSRQAEAIAHDVIESECQYSCNQQHFVGQVQVAPSLEVFEEETEEKKATEE